MINSICFSYRNGTIITYKKDGIKDHVPYSCVKKIWKSLTVDSIEGWQVKVFDYLIAFVIIVASGQGGVLFVWDTDKKEIVHYSEAAYCEDFLIIGTKIITMNLVSNYVTPFHIQMWTCQLGTRDIWETGKRLYCKEPVCLDGENASAVNIHLKLKGQEIIVVVGNQEYLYSDDVSSIEAQKLNPDMDIFENRVMLSNSILLEYNKLPSAVMCDNVFDEASAHSSFESAHINGEDAKLISTCNIAVLIEYIFNKQSGFSQFLELRDMGVPVPRREHGRHLLSPPLRHPVRPGCPLSTRRGGHGAQLSGRQRAGSLP